jgi:hypothetical protein
MSIQRKILLRAMRYLLEINWVSNYSLNRWSSPYVERYKPKLNSVGIGLGANTGAALRPSPTH